MKNKIPVAVLGATGSVGQRFVQLLEDHPWFEIAALTGSERSAGQVYADACRWMLPGPMPEGVRGLKLRATATVELDVPLAFSALPAEAALHAEPELARGGITVCSNASAHRREPDVPVLLPEVNPGHIQALAAQREKRGWKGGIVANPNCTSTGMTVALKALLDAFGLMRVFAVSLQAVSGAGYPGVASLDMLDNVIPHIGGEEEKVEWEPRKMLGSLQGGAIAEAGFRISAHTNRVAVSDGHLVCLSVELGRRAEIGEVKAALRDYQAPPASRALPSAPRPLMVVSEQVDRPQPRLDRMTGAGMTTVVGRVRPDPLFDVKMVVLSHNTVRGAAGGSIYNAELLVSEGWIAA
jgi:aspartate-semialdehyde dehydrogenase